MDIKIRCMSNDEAINNIYTAARGCYSSLPYEELLNTDKSNEEKLKLINRILESGHHSVIEHVSVSLYITGVSRSLTHQLVRHRLASYSQSSQRYITMTESKFEYITPPNIDQCASDEYNNFMMISIYYYNKIYNKLYEGYVANGMSKFDADKKAAEDARYVLPNATKTNIAMTVNLRELIHICNERMCERAQWEIRDLFKEVACLVGKEYPWLKKYLVPKCKTCTEKDMCPKFR